MITHNFLFVIYPPARCQSARTYGSDVENLDDFVQPFDQPIDLLHRIVQVERCTHGSRDLETFVKRHGAMMAGPHRDSIMVQYLGDVMGMNACHGIGDDTSTRVEFGSVDRHTGDFAEAVDVVRARGKRVYNVFFRSQRSYQLARTCNGFIDLGTIDLHRLRFFRYR